jgi:hypothetical protein
MSANNTDPDNKGSRHRAPLLGMSGVVVFAALVFVALLFYLFTRSDGPTRVAPAAPETTQSE